MLLAVSLPRGSEAASHVFEGNKRPSKSIFIVTAAARTKNPMNLFGPCGIYTYEGGRMPSAGFQEPQ